MNGESYDFPVCEFAFACVETRTQLQAVLGRGCDDRARTFDRPRWAVEGSEEAIASGVDFFATKACKLAPDELAVACQQIAPTSVAELSGSLGRN